jgi:hypothetical protein
MNKVTLFWQIVRIWKQGCHWSCMILRGENPLLKHAQVYCSRSEILIWARILLVLFIFFRFSKRWSKGERPRRFPKSRVIVQKHRVHIFLMRQRGTEENNTSLPSTKSNSKESSLPAIRWIELSVFHHAKAHTADCIPPPISPTPWNEFPC